MNNLSEHAETLRRTSLFSDLNDQELARLAEFAVSRRFDANEMIFAEGDICVGLYVIESGAVKIFKTSLKGREQVLSIEKSGASIAELPVFDGGDYPASAAALQLSTLLFVRKKDFHAVCMEHPEVALKVLKVVGRRLRQLVGIIENLSFGTVRYRLAAYLAHRAAQVGKPTSRGIEITPGITNQQLAAQLGTVRELVSRNLNRLQAEGLIELDGKTIVIPDLGTAHGDPPERSEAIPVGDSQRIRATGSCRSEDIGGQQVARGTRLLLLIFGDARK